MSTPSSPPPAMNSFLARLGTFETPHHLAKRRASSGTKSKKSGNTVEWPHAQPSKEALARAGFFYRPAHDSNDNVQCFLCTVKLDGWEETDDPVSEHLAHSTGCAWATAISVSRDQDSTQEPEERDPLGGELYAARQATFTSGAGWPHEGKKGWKCKVAKLVEAGWCWDPSPEGEELDGVTCFYCNLSLDGWEPKDDPFVEHKRREPSCRYFELLEQYHPSTEAPKKGKGRGKARSSTASKVSRMSTQSAVTTASEAPSMPESLGDLPMDSSVARIDDSIVTAGTTTSTATATKGKKKSTRTKAAAKGTKGRKGVSASDDAQVRYPDLDNAQMRLSILPSDQPGYDDEPAPPPPARNPLRAARGANQQQPADSSVVEISATEAAVPKKSTRSRKPKAQPEPESEQELEIPLFPHTPNADMMAQKRMSDVSAQLQDELEHSVDNFGEDLDQSTPVVEVTELQRGVKRTSDGLRKSMGSSVMGINPPATKTKAPAKGKRGKKAVRASAASTNKEQDVVEDQRESQGAEADDEKSQPTKPKAPANKGRGKSKGKKSSSARSSKVTTSAPESEHVMPEDLARDEMEIEQELQRFAAEQKASQQAQGLQVEQELIEEYEPSPSQGRASKDSADMQQLREEVDAEAAAAVDPEPVPTPQRKSAMPGGFTPSPSGSDKENQPSSNVQPQTTIKTAAIHLSPTKTTRVPLATATPNRSPRKVLLSPSKRMGDLRSNAPWTTVDLDAILLPSPQASPDRVGAQLAAAAGVLTSPERNMSVEEWVQYRAVKSEEELRSKCERMVEQFEKEGMRGIRVLEGVEVAV